MLDDVDGFEVTGDGKKLLVVSDKKYAIVDVKADQKLEKPMRDRRDGGVVDPRAEWRQMFADAWRFERDYFYDPTCTGSTGRRRAIGTPRCSTRR